MNEELNSAIDYLVATFVNPEKPLTPTELLTELSEWLDVEDFDEFGKGRHGYARKMSLMTHGAEVITILWGTPEGNRDMGLYLQFSGQGCRLLEQNTDFNWLVLLKKLWDMGARFRRLDIFADDFKGLINMGRLIDYANKGYLKTMAKRINPHEPRNPHTQELLGHGLEIGSRTSELFVRFYDKVLERKAKNADCDLEVWNRCEVELHKDKAQAAVKHLLETGQTVGDFGLGVIAHYLEFQKDDGSREVADWWEEFIKSDMKIDLVQEVKETTLAEKAAWAENQIKRALQTIRLALEKAYNKEVAGEAVADWVLKFSSPEKAQQKQVKQAFSASEEEISLLVEKIGSKVLEVENLERLFSENDKKAHSA